MWALKTAANQRMAPAQRLAETRSSSPHQSSQQPIWGFKPGQVLDQKHFDWFWISQLKATS